MSQVTTVENVKDLLAQGQKLLLAGDERLLEQLPPGDWIAGTTTYFMAEDGRVCTRDLLYVTELPPYVLDTGIKVYDNENIAEVYLDAPANGFSFIIIPAKSPTHLSFALNAPNYKGFALHPLVGWIAGVHLDDLGRQTPKIFSGRQAVALDDGAVVMHVSLPADKVADVGIINIFEQGRGDTITFPEDGFSAKEACINGKTTNFAEYLYHRRLDKRLPLVADYYGAMINTSFQEGEDLEEEVRFYAPVFSGLKYKHAKPVEDYSLRFASLMSPGGGDQVLFSCNCILNALYSEQQASRTEISGPTTFGEIAYFLLNQTLVYLRIIDLPSRSPAPCAPHDPD